MNPIIDGGKTLICLDCGARNGFNEELRQGQLVLCYACGTRMRLEGAQEALTAVRMPADEERERKER